MMTSSFVSLFTFTYLFGRFLLGYAHFSLYCFSVGRSFAFRPANKRPKVFPHGEVVALRFVNEHIGCAHVRIGYVGRPEHVALGDVHVKMVKQCENFPET